MTVRPRRSSGLALIIALESLVVLLEADYYYDYKNVKRWILGPGGKSGNCEICDGNAELGFIDDDDVFDGVDGDVDGPPAHLNCTCTLEYKEQRYRVYD